MKVLMTCCIINWIIILDTRHLKMGYNNLIQIATTELDDTLLREISELCPTDKKLNSVHKFNMITILLISIRLRMQSDMRCKRLDPKLLCKIPDLWLNR